MYWIVISASLVWLFWLTRRVKYRDIFILYVITIVCTWLSYEIYLDKFHEAFNWLHEKMKWDEVDVMVILRLPVTILMCFCGGYFLDFILLRGGENKANIGLRILYGSAFLLIPVFWWFFGRSNILWENIFIVIGFTLVCLYNSMANNVHLIGLDFQTKSASTVSESEYKKLINELNEQIERKEGKIWDHHFVRGNLYFDKGLYAKATKDFDEVINQLSGKTSTEDERQYLEVAFSKRARIKAYDTQWGDAQKDYEQAIANSKNSAKYFNRLDKAQIRNRHYGHKLLIGLPLVLGIMYVDSKRVYLPIKYLPEILPGTWEYTREEKGTKYEGLAVYDTTGHFQRELRVNDLDRFFFNLLSYSGSDENIIGRGKEAGVYLFNQNSGTLNEQNSQFDYEINSTYTGSKTFEDHSTGGRLKVDNKVFLHYGESAKTVTNTLSEKISNVPPIQIVTLNQPDTLSIEEGKPFLFFDLAIYPNQGFKATLKPGDEFIFDSDGNILYLETKDSLLGGINKDNEMFYPYNLSFFQKKIADGIQHSSKMYVNSALSSRDLMFSVIEFTREKIVLIYENENQDGIVKITIKQK